MRVLVTGGTGFIGSALCRRYLEDGHDVRALGKLATPAESRNAKELARAGVEVLPGDVADRSDVARAAARMQLVHHVAAAMREANRGRRWYRRVNVEGTQSVLEESLRAGVEHVVYLSSVGVYGDIRGRVVAEDAPCRPNNLYGETKLEAEHLVRDFARREPLPVVIVRPAEVYGPGDARLLKLFRLIQSRRFVLFGRGEGKHHLVFIDDLVEALDLAARRPELTGQVFTVAGPEPVKLRDLVAEIARQLGVPAPRLRVPLAPVLLLAALVEHACRPLGIPPPIYRRRLEFFRHDWHFDTTRCRQVLGHTPRVSLPEGIARTIDGYQRAGQLPLPATDPRKASSRA